MKFVEFVQLYKYSIGTDPSIESGNKIEPVNHYKQKNQIRKDDYLIDIQERILFKIVSEVHDRRATMKEVF